MSALQLAQQQAERSRQAAAASLAAWRSGPEAFRALLEQRAKEAHERLQAIKGLKPDGNRDPE